MIVVCRFREQFCDLIAALEATETLRHQGSWKQLTENITNQDLFYGAVSLTEGDGVSQQ